MIRLPSRPGIGLLAVTALLISAAGLIAGCGSMGIGEKHFSCQGHPSEPLCLPTSRVYDLTNATDSLHPRNLDDVTAQDAPVRSARPALVATAASASEHNAFLGDDAALFGTTRTAPTPRRPEPAPMLADAAVLGGAEDLLLPRSRDPIPLRMPAEVMRIWLAPWEDRQSDLHASGYVYTEISPKTWTLATGPDRFSNALLTPLQMAVRSPAVPSLPAGQTPPRP